MMSKFRIYNFSACLAMIILIYFLEKALIGQKFDWLILGVYSSWACVVIEISGILFAKALGFRFFLVRVFKYFIGIIFACSSLTIILTVLFEKREHGIYLIILSFHVIVLFLLVTGVLVGNGKILYKNNDIDMKSIDELTQTEHSLLLHCKDRVYKLRAQNNDIIEITRMIQLQMKSNEKERTAIK